jgi:DNA-binding CsgD family transcriptional regulator
MPHQDLTDEEQAVMDVIAAEAAAFFRRDFATYARCWAHKPYVRRMGWWTHGGVSNSWGWDEVSRKIKKSMEDNPTPDPGAEELHFENTVVRISGTMAYATFDQLGPEGSSIGWGARVLERKDGEWRIVHESYIVDVEEPARTAIFKVNRDASLHLMNASAERLIKAGGPLRLVAGRIAATGARETRQIRSAVQLAWDNDRPIPSHLRLRIPILLQQDSDDAVCVCWVASVGSTNACVRVSLNDLGFAHDKLDAASMVFGLSPAQQRLAELIASGHDVVDSADRLGITTNTARTHLRRIYDKIGVRNQAALVRTLLSIDRPE